MVTLILDMFVAYTHVGENLGEAIFSRLLSVGKSLLEPSLLLFSASNPLLGFIKFNLYEIMELILTGD